MTPVRQPSTRRLSSVQDHTALRDWKWPARASMIASTPTKVAPLGKMYYDAVIEVFFQPSPPGVVPAPVAAASPARHLRAAGLLDGDELTAAGRRARDELEVTTDKLVRPIVESLGADLDAVIDQLAQWSELCIAAQAFPPDAFKWAAG